MKTNGFKLSVVLVLSLSLLGMGCSASNTVKGGAIGAGAGAVIGGVIGNQVGSTAVGAIIGAAIMAVIRNAFVLLKMPVYMQNITIGVVIILAVVLDQFRKRST